MMMTNKLSPSFSGALRTFAYFPSNGTHYMVEGIDYLSLYGQEPRAIEQVYAIFVNVIELDKEGTVLNSQCAQKRATDYLRAYCDPTYIATLAYEDWETARHEPRGIVCGVANPILTTCILNL
ncbi:MAG TPA: hypothetical protein VHE34_29040 [Puia sp.]|uniref:DUF7677 family protein n=1 Tax=Puia sp. TaxID=2045100 RepID=UPI002C13D4D9|nr:hypothetical protein [Puia sp.]HVU99316.1 hypothetical protein [Puia sp.]